MICKMDEWEVGSHILSITQCVRFLVLHMVNKADYWKLSTVNSNPFPLEIVHNCHILNQVDLFFRLSQSSYSLHNQDCANLSSNSALVNYPSFF